MDDPREAARLAGKVDARNWTRKFLLPHLTADCRLLELGCGPGELIHAILGDLPSISAVGVDSSPDRIKAAQHRNGYNTQAEFLCRDAMDTGLAENSFDLVFSRFLLEYLPNKQSAVNEMFRLCRPSGKVILQDLDGQLLWHDGMDPDLQVNIEAVLGALASTGFDPLTGRKLRRFAIQAGFTNVQVAIEPYHLIDGAIQQADRRHWQAKFDIAMPLIRDALGSEAAAAHLIQAMLSFFDDPETLTYSILFTVTAEKPCPSNFEGQVPECKPFSS